MTKLEIADIPVEISPEIPDIPLQYIPFVTNSLTGNAFKIVIQPCKNIQEPSGKVILKEKTHWIYKESESQEILLYDSDERTHDIRALLRIFPGWTECTLSYLDSEYSRAGILTAPLLEMLFRNLIADRQGLMVHASAVEWNGKGILFTGPSGMGKSTQAGLWKEHKGAEVLNEDRPAVRVLEGSACVYGTPWSGSTPCYLKRRTSLNAIVVLEQGEENVLLPLQEKEIIRYLLPRCFLPFSQEGLLAKAIQTFNRVVAVTPVYLLRCRPEKDAVEMVAKWLK